MKNLIIVLLLSIQFISVAQYDRQNSSLILEVKGLQNNKGQVMVNIFRKSDEMPSQPYRVVFGEIKNQTSLIEITDLPYGEYAFVLSHDENKNEIVDHGLIMPEEDLDFSNNWSLSLFSGMPTYEKLKVKFDQNHRKLVFDFAD